VLVESHARRRSSARVAEGQLGPWAGSRHPSCESIPTQRTVGWIRFDPWSFKQSVPCLLAGIADRWKCRD
jgi:hypothetical protein